MSSSPVDKKTMGQASSGAQLNDQNLSNYGSQNQSTGQQTQNNVNKATSGFLDPSSTNVTGPTGAFKTQYTNEVNQLNQGTNQALASTNRAMANRGEGKQPSGAQGALTLNAYQNQANQASNLFSQNAMASQNQAMQNFWNAANLQNQQAATDLGLAGSESSAAANNYANLYGTASQQKQNPLMTGLGIAAGVGGALGSAAISK